MVKFAEAEKRGRGGDGGDRRLAPIVMLERPKISRGMWEALKSHIMRDRRRKKEELEADAKVKRMRKERENRKKQHAMTLEETREQITKEKKKLDDLNAQKHDLVQQLKKVINEEKKLKDQEQQQQQQQQQNFLKESSEIMSVHPYTHSSLTLGSHPQMMFPSVVPGRTGNISTLYKVGVSTAQPLQNILPTGSMKRSRTPSPPFSQPNYQQQIPYVPTFKSLAAAQNSVVPVTLNTTKSVTGASVYLSSQPYYHGTNQPSHVSANQYTATSQAAVVAPYLTTPSGPPSLTSVPPSGASARDEKHQSLYLTGGRAPSSHVSAMHQSLDHKVKTTIGSGGGAGSPFPPPPSDGQDKFYVSGVRPHLILQTLPGQQPAPPGSGKGSITTGFPVRSSSSANSQPPHTVSSTIAHSYSGHSINMSRNYF